MHTVFNSSSSSSSIDCCICPHSATARAKNYEWPNHSPSHNHIHTHFRFYVAIDGVSRLDIIVYAYMHAFLCTQFVYAASTIILFNDGENVVCACVCVCIGFGECEMPACIDIDLTTLDPTINLYACQYGLIAANRPMHGSAQPHQHVA